MAVRAGTATLSLTPIHSLTPTNDFTISHFAFSTFCFHFAFCILHFSVFSFFRFFFFHGSSVSQFLVSRFLQVSVLSFSFFSWCKVPGLFPAFQVFRFSGFRFVDVLTF